MACHDWTKLFFLVFTASLSYAAVVPIVNQQNDLCLQTAMRQLQDEMMAGLRRCADAWKHNITRLKRITRLNRLSAAASADR
jgi:hypothetical protein